MRIAWISYDFGEYCVRQAAALARDHDVLLALASAELEPHRGRLGSAEPFEFAPPRLRRPLQQAASTADIVRRVAAFQPDVVHFQHGHLWFNLLGLPRLRRWPLVVTIHDPRRHVGDASSRRTPQWVMDRGYRRADRAIVHGAALRKEAAHALGLPLDRIDVMPHVAIGIPDSPPTTPEDPRCVLFFGRIWAYKGLRYLIEAAPRVAAAVPEVRFVVAGAGEDLTAYRALAKGPARFEFIDRWINDDERSQLFAQAAVVALPYVEASQSGVVPVAYAHGKPVVASRVGALAEAVQHERTGLLAPPRDPAALADALIALLTDPDRRRTYGAAGRRLVDGAWSAAAVAAQTVQTYELAIASRRCAVRRQPRPAAASSKPSPVSR